MPNKAKEDDSKASRTKPLPQVSPVGVRRIIIAGLILLVTLLLVSVFLPNMSERVKFFTVNALSLLVLLAIVVQAYIYRGQWEVMQEMRLITTIGERAYLGIKDVKLVNPIMNNTIVVHVLIFNGGRTPAFNIQRRLLIGLIEKKEKRLFKWKDYPDIETNFTVLPAGAERWITFPQVPISHEMFQEFKAGERMIHTAGEIRFSDFMGMRQIYEFDMTCDFGDNGHFKDTYQRQYSDPA